MPITPFDYSKPQTGTQESSGGGIKPFQYAETAPVATPIPITDTTTPKVPTALYGGKTPQPYQDGAVKLAPEAQPSQLATAFPTTTEGLKGITGDVLNLKPHVSEILPAMWDSIKNAGENEWQKAADFVSSFTSKNRPTSEKVGTGLGVLAGAGGLLFSPVSALFSGAEKIPVLGTVAKAIDTGFSALGEGATHITNGVIDAIPDNVLSKQAKENIKPAIGEIAALASQIIVGGKSAEIIGKAKTELTKKYGLQDTQTIIDKATQLAEQKKSTAPQVGTEIRPPSEIPSEGIKPFDYTRPLDQQVTREVPITPEISIQTKVETPKISTTPQEVVPKEVHNFIQEHVATKNFIDTHASDVVKNIPGAEVVKADLKSPASTYDKVISDYKGDLGKMKDIARNTITVDHISDVPKVVDSLKSSGARIVVEKNLFETPNPAGYRHVILTVEAHNGTMGEIQITTKSLFEAKKIKGDSIYHEVRTIERSFSRQGLKVEGSPEMAKKLDSLKKQGHELYNEAFLKASGKRFSASERVISEPSLKTRESAPTAEISLPEASKRETKTPPSGVLESTTKVSPSSKNVVESVIPKSIPENVGKLNSAVFERMKAEHPELKGDLAYDTIKLKEDAQKAVELIASDKEKAFRVAMGAEEAPHGQTATTVNIAMAEKALAEGNTKLYAQLIKNRSLEQTRRGQEIVAEKGSIGDNNTSRYVKELISARLDNLGGKYLSGLGKLGEAIKKMTPKQKAMSAIDKEVTKVRQKIKSTKELDIEEAQALIDKLACA